MPYEHGTHTPGDPTSIMLTVDGESHLFHKVDPAAVRDLLTLLKDADYPLVGVSGTRRHLADESIGGYHLMGWGSFEELRDQLFSRLCGVLSELALGVQIAFFGDTAHDVLWVNENLDKVREFYYVVRPYGTCIGGRWAVLNAKANRENATLYRVSLDETNGQWVLQVAVVDPESVDETNDPIIKAIG